MPITRRCLGIRQSDGCDRKLDSYSLGGSYKLTQILMVLEVYEPIDLFLAACLLIVPSLLALLG